jgi:hypothetical protein
MERHLVSLYRRDDGKWYIDFGYYDMDKRGNKDWTGISETGELTEEEFYQAVRPKLELQYHERRRAE